MVCLKNGLRLGVFIKGCFGEKHRTLNLDVVLRFIHGGFTEFKCELLTESFENVLTGKGYFTL